MFRMKKYLILGSLFLSFATSPAFAHQRHYQRHYRSSSYHRNANARIQQQKLAMVHTLQAQVQLAKEILSNAESKSSMSQTQALEAMQKLNQVRDKMESSHADVHEALKELQMVEADIQESQPEQSEFAEATRKRDEACKEAHQVMHTLSQTPEGESEQTHDSLFLEMAKLPESERMSVKAEAEYKSAVDKMTATEQQVADIRKKLFDSSKEFREAKLILDKAREESRMQTAKSKPLTATLAHKKQEAIQLSAVIENAKSIIAEGSFRLTQLGVKTTYPNNRPR